MKKLTSKDVCLLIATLNRPEDIDLTLSSLIKNKNIPGKVIIVDQSKDDKTKKAVLKYKNKFPVEYIHYHMPSTDISINLGLRKAKEYKIIFTAGDDVDFFEGYIDEMLNEFNSNPKLMALGGIDLPEKYDFSKIKNKMSNMLFRLFFLPFKQNHKFRITGPYGHTISPFVKKEILDCQWIPGFNTCWRNEIYQDYLWPEIPGYNVIDDLESSYHVYKKYGKNSLMITPKCRVHHRYSDVARYGERKRIFVNHEDHFSYYYRYFNNFTGTFKLIMSLTGIILGNLLRMFFKPKKDSVAAFIYNIEAIIFSIRNRKNIKNEKYRIFLNQDLSMKEKLWSLV